MIVGAGACTRIPVQAQDSPAAEQTDRSEPSPRIEPAPRGPATVPTKELATRTAAQMKQGGLRTSRPAFESTPVQGTANPISARLGQEFDARVGETAAFADEPLTVTFEQVVEDSRCPANTTCVWAGTAVIRLGLRVGDTARGTVHLQTLSEAEAEGVFQKYRLRLVRLAPTPRDSSRIPAEQYVLTLMVRRLE